MPGGEAITLGPFVGGLNNRHHPGNIDDSELSTLENFEVDTDGSLRSRPPIQEIVNFPADTAAALRVIGWGFVNGVSYVIGANGGGTWRYTPGTDDWVKFGGTDTERSLVAVPYEDAFWVVGNYGANLPTSGKWIPTVGWTFISDMSLGIAATVYKDRIWIVQGSQGGGKGSRIAFSGRDSSGNIVWPATNFIDVAPGLYGSCIDIAVVDDNLVIFKSHATYVFGFDSQPEDGILRLISPTIGSAGDRCVTQVGNRTFVLHENSLYELVDYQHVKRDVTVKFDPGWTASVHTRFRYITSLGNRVIVRCNDNMYSYNLNTETWSVFKSESSDLNSIGVLAPVHNITSASDPPTIKFYIAGSSKDSITKCFAWYPDSTVTEQTGARVGGVMWRINCYLETKRVDFGIFHTWKRLFWWGVELFGKGDEPSYDHYAELAIPNNSGSLTTVRTDFGLPHEGKRFVKLKKAVRFRAISFRVRLQNDGNHYTRVFYVVPVIRAPKQTVVRQVNA